MDSAAGLAIGELSMMPLDPRQIPFRGVNRNVSAVVVKGDDNDLRDQLALPQSL